MSDPNADLLANLRNALDTLSRLSDPIVSRFTCSVWTRATLGLLLPSQPSILAPVAAYGVPIQYDQDVPEGILRAHYSDGSTEDVRIAEPPLCSAPCS